MAGKGKNGKYFGGKGGKKEGFWREILDPKWLSRESKYRFFKNRETLSRKVKFKVASVGKEEGSFGGNIQIQYSFGGKETKRDLGRKVQIQSIFVRIRKKLRFRRKIQLQNSFGG